LTFTIIKKYARVAYVIKAERWFEKVKGGGANPFMGEKSKYTKER